MCCGKSIDTHGKLRWPRGKSMVKNIPLRYQLFIMVRVPKYIYLAGQMPHTA